MLCLIVEIVQYLKPLPPLLYKSTFSLYTILFLLTSQKSIFLHYYFILLYLYYTLYPTFFVHIFFFVVVLLFSTATLLHFFVFVLHTFCIIFFLCLLWIKEPFSLYFFCFYLIFFQFYIGNYSYISIFFHFLSRIQKEPSTVTSWPASKVQTLLC